MTAMPTPANRNMWWLTTAAAWDRLHAVPRAAVDPDDEDACDRLRCNELPLTAACGVTAVMAWPGLASRLGLPRCAHCCRALGIPRGGGTPGNDDTLEDAPMPDTLSVEDRVDERALDNAEPRDVDLPHSPMVAPLASGEWGVSCLACSDKAQDYVPRCVVNPDGWPPLVLREAPPSTLLEARARAAADTHGATE